MLLITVTAGSSTFLSRAESGDVVLICCAMDLDLEDVDLRWKESSVRVCVEMDLDFEGSAHRRFEEQK